MLTLSGIVISLSWMQPEKAYCPIALIPDPRMASSNDIQFLKQE